jgi:hypothetical protein
MHRSIVRGLMTALLVAASSTALSAPAAATTLGPAEGVHHKSPRYATSLNWAGYAATGGRGAFESVTATWTVPSVTCSSSDSYSAFWVGLDGYGSPSVEQIGTSSDCLSNTPTYAAWYEFYPAAPQPIGSVTAGHTIVASVIFDPDTSTYTLSLTDNGSEVGSGPFEFTPKRKFARSSAEVIAERPSIHGGPFGPLPLAAFDLVTFTALAVNGSSGFGTTPTEFVMFNTAGDTIADPEHSITSSSDPDFHVNQLP